MKYTTSKQLKYRLHVIAQQQVTSFQSAHPRSLEQTISLIDEAVDDFIQPKAKNDYKPLTLEQSIYDMTKEIHELICKEGSPLLDMLHSIEYAALDIRNYLISNKKPEGHYLSDAAVDAIKETYAPEKKIDEETFWKIHDEFFQINKSNEVRLHYALSKFISTANDKFDQSKATLQQDLALQVVGQIKLMITEIVNNTLKKQ